MKLKLFIQIFIKLLKSEIKFPRAGPKPLICEQCLLIKGIFREKCNDFIIKFLKEPHNKQGHLRAKETTESFIASLNKLIDKLDGNEVDHNTNQNEEDNPPISEAIESTSTSTPTSNQFTVSEVPSLQLDEDNTINNDNRDNQS